MGIQASSRASLRWRAVGPLFRLDRPAMVLTLNPSISGKRCRTSGSARLWAAASCQLRGATTGSIIN